MFLAATEQIYEAAAQSGLKTPMDPAPPFGLWGWSKTYIAKSPYDVGQSRVLHGPKGTTIKSASQEQEDALILEGPWTLKPHEVAEDEHLTESEKQSNELTDLRQQLKIQQEALEKLLSERDTKSGRKGRHDGD